MPNSLLPRQIAGSVGLFGMFIKRLAWLGVVLGTAGLICPKLGDADLWWHVIVGRWILANGAFPHVDYWNIFGVGKPWRAYSWSNEVVYSLVESTWGLSGLLVLQCCLALALILILAGVFSVAARSFAFGLAVTLPVLFCLHAHFALRPQTFTWMLFALLLSLAFRVSKEGPKRSSVSWLVVLICLWANTHLSALLGILAVLGILFADAILGRALRELVLLISLLIFATLFTPYWGGEWLSLIESARHPLSYTSIAEFVPGHFQQPGVLMFMMLLLLLGIFLHYRPRTLTSSQIVTLVFFSVLGVGIIKFLPFAAIFLGFVIARVWGETEGRPALLGDLGQAIDRGLTRLAQPPFAVGALLLGLISGMSSLMPVFAGSPVDTSLVPEQAFNFIEEQHLPHPLLSGFNEGGYLIYRFSDDFGLPLMRVALDGRTNVNDPRIFRAFEKTFNGVAGWNELLDVVVPGTILWNNALPLGAILESSGQWRRVFGSPESKEGWSVFVRKVAPPPDGPEDMPADVPADSTVKPAVTPSGVIPEAPRARLVDPVDSATQIAVSVAVPVKGPVTAPAVREHLLNQLRYGDSVCLWGGFPESTLSAERTRQRALVWFRSDSRITQESQLRTGFTPIIVPDEDPQIGGEFDESPFK